jgi:hypothetical protein
MSGEDSLCIDTRILAPPASEITHHSKSAGSMGGMWPGVMVSWSGLSRTDAINPAAVDFGTTVTASDGQGHTNTNESYSVIPLGPHGTIQINVSQSPTGTWSMSVPWKERATYYVPSSSSMVNGSPYPNYGGSVQADGLSARGILFELIADTSGTLDVSVAYGGASVSLSYPVASAFVIGHQSTGNTNSSSFHVSAAFSCASSVGFNSDLNLPSESWAASDGYGNGTVTMSGTTINASCTCTPRTTGPDASSSGTCTIQPDTSYQLNARATCFGDPYTGSGLLLWTHQKAMGSAVQPLNPSSSSSWSQRLFSASASIESSGFSDSLNELVPVASWLSNASLIAAGEDTRDWRTMYRGFKWDALSISRPSAAIVDACTSTANWSAGSHTTLGTSGGHLTIAALGGSGSATLAVPSSVRVWEAWRYLRFTGSLAVAPYDNSHAYVAGDLVSSGGTDYQCISPTTGNAPPNATYWTVVSPSFPVSLTVTMAGHTWPMKIGSSSTSVDLDLCCAGDETATTNGTKQTRFPIQNPGGYPDATDPTVQYSMGWGVDFCDSIQISGIPSGMVLTLTLCDLEALTSGGQQSLTCLSPFLEYDFGWTSATDNTSLNPYLLVETDYRVSDWPGVGHIAPFTGSDSMRWFTITDAHNFLAYLGITATLLTTPTDGYHDDTLEAMLLGCLGATYDFGSSTWTDWVDHAIGTTLPAQDAWDEVQAWPGCGNPWIPTGGVGGDTPLQVSVALRGQAWGLDFTSADQPRSGQSVISFNTSSMANTGTATTGTYGQYTTTSPYGPGNNDTTTQIPHTSMSAHGMWENRRRNRTSFRGSPPAITPLAYDVSRTFRHARITSRTGSSNLWIGTAPNGNPYAWTDYDSGIVSQIARIRWQDNGNEPLGILYVQASTPMALKFIQTPDEGATFTSPMTISTSLAPGGYFDFDETRDFNRWFYWLQGSSAPYTVYMCVLDAENNLISGPNPTNLTNADLSPVVVRESPVAGGARQIGLQYSVSGTVTFLTARDGINFM